MLFLSRKTNEKWLEQKKKLVAKVELLVWNCFVSLSRDGVGFIRRINFCLKVLADIYISVWCVYGDYNRLGTQYYRTQMLSSSWSTRFYWCKVVFFYQLEISSQLIWSIQWAPISLLLLYVPLIFMRYASYGGVLLLAATKSIGVSYSWPQLVGFNTGIRCIILVFPFWFEEKSISSAK